MSPKFTQAEVDEKLLGFVRNAGYRSPTLLQKNVLPHTLQGRDIVVEAEPGEGRTGLLIVSLLMQIERSAGGLRGLILTASADEVFKVIRQYRKFAARFHGRPHIIGLGTDDNLNREIHLLSRKPDIVAGTSERIIDHLRRENITVDNVESVVLIVPEDPELAGFEKDVSYIYSKLSGNYLTQVYCHCLDRMSGLSPVLRRPIQVAKADWCRVNDSNERERNVEKKSERKSNNHEKTVEYVREILRAIKESESPHELDELRRVFRRNTPLHLRAYFAAYLIREAIGSSPAKPGTFSTLFVSIGKNRKVFPKDLKKLFASQLGISGAQLGEIKVLDNYSFIEITEPFAQKAIDKLNATEFRGRRITVNFARKKREDSSQAT